MSDKLRMRSSEIYVSDETLFYLKLKARQMVQDTDASMTVDQVGDSILREQLTTENPDFVTLWAEMAEAKKRAIKEYRAIENKAVAGTVPAPVESGFQEGHPGDPSEYGDSN